MELPVSYQEKMKALLGPKEYEAYRNSLDAPSYRGLRVNTGKLEAEEFEKISPFPCVKIPWIPNGYYIPEDANASRHPYYAAGLYYLQEPSAMTPARTLPIEPGDKVLDLCAAPGGKATELAAKTGPEGLLVANDISNSRAKGLLKNLELFGSPHILVTSETPERLVEYFPEFFDKILIDAPCSGEGMFRKDPSMIKSWLEHGPEYYAAIQRQIVLQAAKMLKPGGMLLYSTCTFDPEENEGTIEALLETHPEFSVVELDDDLKSSFLEAGFCPGRPDLIPEGKEELKHCFRLYPHKVKGEGHFLALLQKSGEARGDSKMHTALSESKKKNDSSASSLESFLDVLPKDYILKCREQYNFRIQQTTVYALPQKLPQIRALRFLRTGCLMGELSKQRFEPSQALAMVLKKSDWPLCIDFSTEDDRVIRYLKGETLDIDDLSPMDSISDQKTRKQMKEIGNWALVCVDGHPLGWAKIVNGTLRNKYYPGWRW